MKKLFVVPIVALCGAAVVGPAQAIIVPKKVHWNVKCQSVKVSDIKLRSIDCGHVVKPGQTWKFPKFVFARFYDASGKPLKFIYRYKNTKAGPQYDLGFNAKGGYGTLVAGEAPVWVKAKKKLIVVASTKNFKAKFQKIITVGQPPQQSAPGAPAPTPTPSPSPTPTPTPAPVPAGPCTSTLDSVTSHADTGGSSILWTAHVTCNRDMTVQAHFWLSDLRVGPDSVGELTDSQRVTAGVSHLFQGDTACSADPFPPFTGSNATTTGVMDVHEVSGTAPYTLGDDLGQVESAPTPVLC